MPDDVPFTPVGPVAALVKGHPLALRVAGRAVMVVSLGDQVVCLADCCSHGESPLSTGRVRGDKILCPLHGARFDLRTGRHLSPPATRGVPCYPVRVRDGVVEVAVPPAAEEPA